MYAFAQRDDTRVVDEPLYAHYLAASGALHPGREDVLASQASDGADVVRNVILGSSDRDILFIKQMAHHMLDLDVQFLSQLENAFLIRDPRQMLPSLINQVPHPDLDSTGLNWQSDLHRRLVAADYQPIVLDARELLLDPQHVLRTACERLGIGFDEKMLSWQAGPRPENGVWAPHWYHNVHKSTGFGQYREKTDPFPSRLSEVLEACRPHYEYLYRFAIKAHSRTNNY
jgi:hypothetical protein